MKNNKGGHETSKEESIIMVMSGPDDGRVYRIDKDVVSIGKAENNDIAIKADRSVVANHAFLMKESGKFYICIDNRKEPLKNGDIFEVGLTELKIRYPEI